MDATIRRRIRTCRILIKARRRIVACLGTRLSTMPAWDMLLDLYIARHEGRAITIWSLCLTADVPASTAHRKIGEMIDAGVLVRAHRGGRVSISLSPVYLARMDALLDELAVLGAEL
ncbi:MAG: MarR family transcriptional regulator [Stutzerimonas stutzeri]|nr:MAG: MarR family transcriptional regulator [Stutzerimonas stutzeri]